MPIDWVALLVFVLLFGFIAVRWRRRDLGLLHEWGLAGSRFGTVLIWFLLGGDLYTAYTFIAVPALLFGTGALGFFAVLHDHGVPLCLCPVSAPVVGGA